MMKKYEKYQSSELPWIYQIPEHWKMIRNGALFTYHQDKVGESFNKYNLLSLTTNGIRCKDIENVKGKVPASYEGYQIVNIGDMVFCLFDLDCSAVFSGISAFKGMITSAYDVLTPNSEMNAEFLDYWFQSVFFGRYYKIFSKSVRYTINYDTFKAIKSPVPPREEQDQIVRFLDYKISKINCLIKGYQKQIKLLKERRANVIELAVTQGIDDSVELKASGAHWLPRIPKHWNMVYSKKLFAQRKDKAFPGDIQLTSSQKYGIVSQDEYMRIEGRRLTVVMTGADILKHVGKGDFVISMRSFQGGLEYSYVEGKISSAYVMLIPDHEKVYDEYFKWLLKSKSYIKALQGTSDLVRDGQALRYANFAKVSLPEIPLDEQKAIAEYIESEVNKIDKALPFFQKQIDILREYRTHLISDVITGQIDVQDEVIPEYTAVENEPETSEEAVESEVEENADEC